MGSSEGHAAETPGVAILVPCYRCEATIEETLQSIQDQGPALARVQAVYVADDGSDDATAEIARRCWRSPTPLVMIANTYNCGEYAHVNHVVEGFPDETTWFLIMHGDNVAKPGWLATLLTAIDQADERIGSISTSYDTYDGQGILGRGEDRGVEARHVEEGPASIAHTLLVGCWWHISACAIRVAAYREVGGLPKVMQQKGDWDFSLRLLTRGWAIEYLPVTTMLYRSNPAGSSSLSSRRHIDVLEALMVISRFQRSLPLAKLLSVHGIHASFLVRRMGSSLLRRDWARLSWTVPAGTSVGANLISCLLERRAASEG